MARSISRVLSCVLLGLAVIVASFAAPALADDDGSTDIVVNVKKTTVVTGSISITMPTTIPLATNTGNKDDADFGVIRSSSNARIVNGGSNDAVVDRVTIGSKERRLSFTAREEDATRADARDVLYVVIYDAGESTASYDQGTDTWTHGEQGYGINDAATPRFTLDNTVGELTGFSHRWTVPGVKGGQMGFSRVGVTGRASALSREWNASTICTIDWVFSAAQS